MRFPSFIAFEHHHLYLQRNRPIVVKAKFTSSQVFTLSIQSDLDPSRDSPPLRFLVDSSRDSTTLAIAMREFTTLLALPASLLSIIAIPAVQAAESRRLYQHDRASDNPFEIERHMKRDAEVQARLFQQKPLGVRKMSDDHGQKFLLEYWTFDDLDTAEDSNPRHFDTSNNSSLHTDASAAHLSKPIAPHTNHDRQPRSIFARSLFTRDFDCPSDTNSCGSIGYDGACCPADESCVSTSSGVGCCASGQTCGDEITGCDTDQGYTECSNDSSGGCCIPGAECESGGCVFYGTQTVTTTLAAETDTEGVSVAIETSSGREVTVVYTDISVSAYTTTETVTATPSGYTTTRTVNPESESGTTAAGAPILPTSDDSVSAATITSTSSVATTATDESCPTGFYMCSARYLGGCCRVDRNCDSTSCPAQDTTTVIDGDSRTVEAASTTGSCANGWFLCGAEDGGGCCPNGYDCGIDTCNAASAGEQDTGKQAPSEAMVTSVRWSLVMAAVGVGMGMVWL